MPIDFVGLLHYVSSPFLQAILSLHDYLTILQLHSCTKLFYVWNVLLGILDSNIIVVSYINEFILFYVLGDRAIGDYYAT